MWIKGHCEDCERLLSEDFINVHKFIDQYSEIFDVCIFGEYHRTFLHNQAGLEVIKAQCGYSAYLAGAIHISRDYFEIEMNTKDLKWILDNLGKALLYFNNMNNLDPKIDPRVVSGWGNKSLCHIAFGNNGYDQYYRHLKDM